MTQKFVLRVLDAAGELLAWAEVYATARPQPRPAGSCPFFAPENATKVPVVKAGRATQVSIHWCDLDVARKQNVLEPFDVEVGQTLLHSWLEPVWLVPGMRDVPLPAVTVSAPVGVEVPVGSLNAIVP